MTHVIHEVAICTMGEATGHGVQLDADFIADVERQGNASPAGIKSRFGHPSMSGDALGTHIGRVKNFHQDGDVVRGDLHLSPTAAASPNGDLRSYTEALAADDPDAFGMSIVFTPGEEYQKGSDGVKIHAGEPGWDRDGKIFATCEKLHAADAVDEPAANDGMFHAESKALAAGVVHEFLDTHPEVWEFLKDPEIRDPFMVRYEEYQTRNTEPADAMADAENESTAMETVIDEVVPEAEMPETETPAETPEEAAEMPETETPAETPEEMPALSARPEEELAEIAKRFGADALADAVTNNLTLEACRDKHYTQLEDRLKMLDRGSDLPGEAAAVTGGNIAEAQHTGKFGHLPSGLQRFAAGLNLIK
jgi:hypothetical protein